MNKTKFFSIWGKDIVHRPSMIRYGGSESVKVIKSKVGGKVKRERNYNVEG